MKKIAAIIIATFAITACDQVKEEVTKFFNKSTVDNMVVETKTTTEEVVKKVDATKVDATKIEVKNTDNSIEAIKADYEKFNQAKEEQKAVIQTFQQEIDKIINNDASQDELKAFLGKLKEQAGSAMETLKNIETKSDAVTELKNETVSLFNDTKLILEKTLELGLIDLEDNDKIISVAKEIEEKSKSLISGTEKVEKMEGHILNMLH